MDYTSGEKEICWILKGEKPVVTKIVSIITVIIGTHNIMYL